jgi:hypothetical protein
VYQEISPAKEPDIFTCLANRHDELEARLANMDWISANTQERSRLGDILVQL